MSGAIYLSRHPAKIFELGQDSSHCGRVCFGVPSHSWHHSGKSWEHPDQHQGPWLHPEEIPAKPYGSYTHSIVDAKPLGEGCRALLKHSAHACAAHRAHHVEKEGDDDIE